MKTALGLAVASVVALAPIAPAIPCCMVPATYKGTISQSAQEAVLLHADGREELVLRINYKITGATMPDRFAWIITVPNEPDAYAVADGKLFEDVFAWAENVAKEQTRGKSLGKDAPAAADGGLEFGKAVKIGPFDIQPVRALGKEALKGLNAWLEKNGFPTEDEKHMEYFVENKFTFLCVKVVPAKDKAVIDPAGGLPPLHLSFRSANPYYPLRFSSRQGVFDVNLYVLTKKEFDYAASDDSLRRINWGKSEFRKNVEVAFPAFPKTLKDAYGKSSFKDDAGKWFLNVLRTQQVNRDNAISKWTEDIFFKTRG